MTNADRIRNMTDEELAHFIAKIKGNINALNMSFCTYQAEEVSVNWKWLQKEVEE